MFESLVFLNSCLQFLGRSDHMPIPTCLHFIVYDTLPASTEVGNIVDWTRTNPPYHTKVWCEPRFFDAVVSALSLDIRHSLGRVLRGVSGKDVTLSWVGAKSTNYLVVKRIECIPEAYGGAYAELLSKGLNKPHIFCDLVSLAILEHEGGFAIDYRISPSGRSLPPSVRAPHHMLLARTDSEGKQASNCLIASYPKLKNLIQLRKMFTAAYSGMLEFGLMDVSQEVAEDSQRYGDIAAKRHAYEDIITSEQRPFNYATQLRADFAEIRYHIARASDMYDSVDGRAIVTSWIIMHQMGCHIPKYGGTPHPEPRSFPPTPPPGETIPEESLVVLEPLNYSVRPYCIQDVLKIPLELPEPEARVYPDNEITENLLGLYQRYWAYNITE